MTMIGGNLTNLDRDRLLSVEWTVPFILQKSLFTLMCAMLATLVVIVLPAGSAMQMYGQTASVPAPSPVPEHQNLPNAPSASGTAAPPQAFPPRSSFALAHGPPQPMDIGGKFKYIIEPAFGPRALFTTAFGAGLRMAKPPSHYPHEWHSGAEAYGRLYGDVFARDGAVSVGRFSASVLLHEDPRYRRSESTSVPGRVVHALVFTLVDRTDGGHPTLAISNFTGAAAGGFIGMAYLPAGFNDLTHAGQRSGIAFGNMAGRNLSQELSPELGRLLTRIHLPHIPLPPVWWTGNK